MKVENVHRGLEIDAVAQGEALGHPNVPVLPRGRLDLTLAPSGKGDVSGNEWASHEKYGHRRDDGNARLHLVTASDLLPTLTSAIATRQERILYLQANELLDYGWVLDVMDLCRRAGADEVALITRRKTDTSVSEGPKDAR